MAIPTGARAAAAPGSDPPPHRGRAAGFAHADWSGYSIFEEAFTRGHLAGTLERLRLAQNAPIRSNVMSNATPFC